MRLSLYETTIMSSDQEDMASSTDATPDPDAYDGSPLMSLEVMNAKLNMVITKQAVTDNKVEAVWDEVQGIRKAMEATNHSMATMANAILEINQKLSTQERPLNYRTRYAIAFSGGLAGGFAGGAVVTFLLKLGLFLSVPAAVAVVAGLH